MARDDIMSIYGLPSQLKVFAKILRNKFFLQNMRMCGTDPFAVEAFQISEICGKNARPEIFNATYGWLCNNPRANARIFAESLSSEITSIAD